MSNMNIEDNNSQKVKLVVLIPAYNEEELIGKTILAIPRKIIGVSQVQVLVVDDGSTDKTVDVAINAGADKIVSHSKNLGVGAAFMTGIRNAITMDADILVTLDGDAQFPPEQISSFIVPLLNKECDVISGARFVDEIPPDYPRTKLLGNKIFSKLVSFVTGQKFVDTQTGFRAYSKEAMLNVSIVSEFNFAQEVLLDLCFKKFKITETPVKVKFDKNRKSRIVRSISSYSYKATVTILRSIFYHRPILAFGLFGILLCSAGTIAKILKFYDILNLSGDLSNGLVILGVVSFMMGLFANVVFKRQAFTERDLRLQLRQSSVSKNLPDKG